MQKIMLLLVIVSFIFLPVTASPPPPASKVNDLLICPDTLNFFQTDNQSSLHGDDPGRLFPPLSGDRAYKEYSFGPNDSRFVGETWYFSDWDSFETGKEELLRYTETYGKTGTVILNISDSLTNYQSSDRKPGRSIKATRFQDNSTTGYFFVVNNPGYPGENYFITYYGTIGSPGADTTRQLEYLIGSCFSVNERFSIDDLQSDNQSWRPTVFDATPAMIILVLCLGIILWCQYHSRKK